MLVDTHAHLYANAFDEDRNEMLQRTFDAGVEKIYLPNVDLESVEGMFALERDYPGKCFAMMGLHPCSVGADYKEVLEKIRAFLDARQFCAIGEIGIDLYWDKTYFKEQQDAFLTQIRWAKEFARPIVIHARDSMDEILEIVVPEQDGTLKGIFHCYSGNEAQTRQILDMGGFLFGIGGTVTFKNSGKTLRSVLDMIGLDNMVLETDAPYLTPVPFRGKRNESSYIPLVAERLSEELGVSLEEIAEITGRNSCDMFSPYF